MNLIKVNEKFPDELAAIKYFEKARWGNNPKCAYCGSDKLSNRKKDHRFSCKECSKSFSVTVGTMLHKTRIPLRKWLVAFSLIAGAKKGIRAKQLERNLDVSYKTAWRMRAKIKTFVGEDVNDDDMFEILVANSMKTDEAITTTNYT